MINAKDEFLEHIACKPRVKAVHIRRYDCWCKENQCEVFLKGGYREDDFVNFLNSIDFEYDNGIGSQEITGAILCEDGTWSSRGEYDGSEWWQHHKIPQIPDYLKG